jgi:hypothetical protein
MKLFKYDDYGYSDKGANDEGWADTYRWGNKKYGRAYKRSSQYAGQVFTGKDGRVWERYMKDGVLKVKPYKGLAAT